MTGYVHDNTVMVQGDVGETMHAEEQKDAEKEHEEQIGGEEGEELQANDELKQRVIARQ
jgi:hypothetical protein